MKRLHRSLLVLILLAAGCATYTPEAGPGTPAFLAAQVARARALEDQGRLAEAIRVWRIVQAADPSHAEASSDIARLIAERDARVRALLIRAGEVKTTRSRRALYLRVLALDGANKTANGALRSMFADNALGNQQSKDEDRRVQAATRDAANDLQVRLDAHRTRGDLQGVIRAADAALSTDANNRIARAFRYDAHLALSTQARNDGRLEDALIHLDRALEMPADDASSMQKTRDELKLAVSQQLFAAGVKLERSDLDGAIELWERALAYHPDNARINARLRQARRMQDNLRRIKSAR